MIISDEKHALKQLKSKLDLSSGLLSKGKLLSFRNKKCWRGEENWASRFGY